MIKIAHIITSLDVGGAEMMLYNLLSVTDRTLFDPQVICLKKVGVVAEKIRELGVPVRSLNLSPKFPNPLAVGQLARQLRRDRIDIVQTWMYHADLVGGIAAKLGGNIPVVWGIHHTELNLEKSSRYLELVMRLLAHWAGKMPTKIVSCSIIAKQIHIRKGYPEHKFVVIPNGFDTESLRPDAAAYADIRRELDIPLDALIVGMVARFDPQKDHFNFVQTAQQLQPILPGVYFILCGKEVSWENAELAGWIDAAGLRPYMRLLGIRKDGPRLSAVFDVATLSSAYGEAFPMVIGEAMAAGTPCVATDVGDTAFLIDDTGIVVPPKNPEALADGWSKLLQLPRAERQKLGSTARARIQQHFSLAATAQQFAALYQELVKTSGGD